MITERDASAMIPFFCVAYNFGGGEGDATLKNLAGEIIQGDIKNIV